MLNVACASPVCNCIPTRLTNRAKSFTGVISADVYALQVTGTDRALSQSLQIRSASASDTPPFLGPLRLSAGFQNSRGQSSLPSRDLSGHIEDLLQDTKACLGTHIPDFVNQQYLRLAPALFSRVTHAPRRHYRFTRITSCVLCANHLL